MVFLAILLGIMAGAIGFAPLLFGLRWAHRNPEVGNIAPMTRLVICLIISFVLVFAITITFVLLDKADAIAFVIAEVIALSVIAIAYGIHSVKSRQQ